MIRILHLDDNPLDHKLVKAKLLESNVEFDIHWVDSAEKFEAALSTSNFDVILSDYSLPMFDGKTALSMVQRFNPDLPFIIVSGAMGELAAVEILRAGATDYILKDHLELLVPAVNRALREAGERVARKEAEEALKVAKEVAESANRAKDRFIAVLSHELRTPLTPVLFALKNLEKSAALPLALKRDVQIALRNVGLECKLIDDLLDVSLITSGKLRLNLKICSAHTLINHILEMIAKELEAKQVTVSLDLKAQNHIIYVDNARFEQVLWNLIRNAVKFTPQGGSIVVRSSNTADRSILIEVQDSGIGISEDELSKIFNAFEQAGEKITQRFGGMGLGLAISKAVVDMLHGRIWATSGGEGKGASFFVSMPLATSESDEQPLVIKKNQPIKTQLPAALTILLVEDHPDSAELLETLLSGKGHMVRVAHSVSAALQLASNHSFDLVLSDIGLPDGTGNELMKELSNKYHLKGIALTGYGMEDDIVRAKQSGFMDHMTKPIDFDRLDALITSIM